ncbi:MAG: choice-of-anchor D domain-containing protein [Candidatus Kapabacteria bacterium]|nr:choice-of-anchor D domain-containing protein [Candidatus Kapabacteria bacterium]
MVGVEAALAGDDGLGKAVSPVYYLVNGGKIVNYYGFADQGPTTTQIAAGELPNYFQDVVYMPYAAEFNNSYPMSDFSAAVFSFDAYWLNIRGELLTSIEDMLKAKKGVWVQSQAGMTAVYVQYPTNVQFDATRAWYKNVVGIEFVKGEPRAQQNGNQINLLPIPVKGVAKDPIGDGVAFTGNQYGQAWPFYNQAVTDIMKLTSGSLAKSVLYMDNLAANIGMVRVSPTYGGRLVYSSIGTEVMSDAVQRKKLVGNVFDWLLNTTAGKPSISVSQSILNFGSVEVDLMKDMSVEITNTGTAELSISALNFTGADAASFYVSAGGPVGINPIKIAVGAKHTIKVTFAPSAVKNIFGAVLNFTSNADTPPTVQLRGSSSITSVETDVVSETGAIGMKLVGSNPITDNTSVRVSGNGNIAITVVDAAGRTVSTLFDGSINGTQSVSIASSALASGTYSIVASNGSDRAVLTVMVVR